MLSISAIVPCHSEGSSSIYLCKSITWVLVVVAESLSHVWLFATLETASHQTSLSFTISRSLLTHVHWVNDAIQPSHPLSSTSPSALNLSQDQGLFQWVSSSHQVAKVLELPFQHQPFNEYSGLISFRIDWFDLLAVQETLKSLPQHHSLKASLAFSLLYDPTLTSIHVYWKNHSLDCTDLYRHRNAESQASLETY